MSTPLRSMTGYGRGTASGGGVAAVVEIRSVNHRFIDVSVKSSLRDLKLDDEIRRAVKERFARGAFEVSVAAEREDQTEAVTVNGPLLASYMKIAERLSGEYGIAYPPDFSDLVGLRDLFTTNGARLDAEAARPAVAAALAEALDRLDEARRKEGAQTAGDVKARVAAIGRLVAEAAELHGRSAADRHEKLRARIARLTADHPLDEGRIAQEAALLVDRADVSEEVERLSAHLTQVEGLFSSGEPVGRKLEFYVQEIGRETNTFGSKTSSPEATARVVEIKSEIEKIREQAQNVE